MVRPDGFRMIRYAAVAHLEQLNADQLQKLLIESQARIDNPRMSWHYKRQRYGVKAEHLSRASALSKKRRMPILPR